MFGIAIVIADGNLIVNFFQCRIEAVYFHNTSLLCKMLHIINPLSDGVVLISPSLCIRTFCI